MIVRTSPTINMTIERTLHGSHNESKGERNIRIVGLSYCLRASDMRQTSVQDVVNSCIMKKRPFVRRGGDAEGVEEVVM